MVNLNMAPIHVKCVKITFFKLESVGVICKKLNLYLEICI